MDSTNIVPERMPFVSEEVRERGDEEKLLVVSYTDEPLVDVIERGDEEKLLVVSYRRAMRWM
jgi:hypothetical protein